MVLGIEHLNMKLSLYTKQEKSVSSCDLSGNHFPQVLSSHRTALTGCKSRQHRASHMTMAAKLCGTTSYQRDHPEQVT